MKLVWSPETASKAYIDTVKSCKTFSESSVAELVSAMAAGWNARLIVETWCQGGDIATSIGLAVASNHTGGRHICIVPDEESRSNYYNAVQKPGLSVQVIVGGPDEAMEGLDGIDFLVVDCKQDEYARILQVAKLGQRGAVLVCKNTGSREALGFMWRSFVDGKSRIVRSVFLPVGKGLDIAHVGAKTGNGKGDKKKWIKHIDTQSGEEFVIRK
ncbi:uncharacterized protein LOC111393981 [Olea europaea var. sylvestris]|uniref:uncharacterized protein LOC111393981 n=1 Tax=Olea europaea var. sylvestris TaxID=158386 RepID=UPI000C1D47A8|nr:uncharacterized protein LOC111393981 [Olea europaea var. sylvestris]